MDFYKTLWTKIGGRPWTFILRDIWHRYEWFWIVVLVAAGSASTQLWGIEKVFISLGVFTIGYIAGHLFWGKEYVPDQGKAGKEVKV